MRSTTVLPFACALALSAGAGEARAIAPSRPADAAPTTAATTGADSSRAPRPDSTRAAGADTSTVTSVAAHLAPGSSMTFGAWFGAAERSPTGALGRVPERALRLLAVRLAWNVSHTRHAALDYQLDLVPLARISGPRLLALSQYCGKGGPCDTEWAIADDHAVYGAGISPVGFQLRWRPGKTVQPFAAMSAGVLVFSRPVPVDDAQRFNFTGELGAGAIVGRVGKLGMLIGYKFHHLSNGGMGPVNPGMDGNVVYAGVVKVPR